VDILDVEIPGSYVKALTSASSLVREVFFSKSTFEKKKLEKRKKTALSKVENEKIEA
jgi:hypothetical protein